MCDIWKLAALPANASITSVMGEIASKISATCVGTSRAYNYFCVPVRRLCPLKEREVVLLVHIYFATALQ